MLVTHTEDYKIIQADATQVIEPSILGSEIDLTFLDPPFNQNKEYSFHKDDLPDRDYWQMMGLMCQHLFEVTSEGGAIYFMQREKNSEQVLKTLRETGWTFQNLIVWKKKTSAVPSAYRYSKQYQILGFATKGRKPRVFHRLRIDPPLLPEYKYERKNGLYVTDVWDDIRELTSGYFAGDEAIRTPDGKRFHKQQAPLSLLVRIILCSSNPGDVVLDPFSGTGTTAVVANQLNRRSISVEISPENVACVQERLTRLRKADNIHKYYGEYRCTENIEQIWGTVAK
ncbi:site-specific DNA-methyltransferase [Oscillatoria sp. FACHB-1406]|uniref:DNA-methyltransferase n=1 Tax=Oscillatoria sp. FACHB-1406 TaxID=2692846 RepID=UPI001683E278|nr:site-specific DNA-methyltransferase [Oscillatoria sp. FACHB-1406]MBD2580354.1 site-specific DNA-methyltransferase [Oscillatoria sp. FACHB-1406]